MGKGTILVVEDSPTELRLITEALQAEGYEVITATNGDEALAKAARARPRLVLLDIVLPKQNGFQVCRQLKSSADTKDVKVILVSSKSQETDRLWGLRQGADEYITKPFKTEDLLRSVLRHMS
jgi:twitching motility two-component system response regulator PilH